MGVEKLWTDLISQSFHDLPEYSCIAELLMPLHQTKQTPEQYLRRPELGNQYFDFFFLMCPKFGETVLLPLKQILSLYLIQAYCFLLLCRAITTSVATSLDDGCPVSHR